MELILASGSQRRRELLTMCGYDYEIIVSNADESIDESDPEKFVRALSLRKAREVFDRLYTAGKRDFAVIGSDTVVAFKKDDAAQAEIIGKPHDAADAVRILSMLSGRTHRVFTGVSVIADVTRENAAENPRVQTECCITEVTFEALTEREILDYVNSGDPLDKAGSYGIQGPFGMFVREIRGNYFNVIGMPIPVLYKMLKKIGILPNGFSE